MNNNKNTPTMHSKFLSILTIAALGVTTGTACVYGAHSLERVQEASVSVAATQQASSDQTYFRKVVTRCDNAKETLAANLRVKANSKKYWRRRHGESYKQWERRVRPQSAGWSAQQSWLIDAKSNVERFCR